MFHDYVKIILDDYFRRKEEEEKKRFFIKMILLGYFETNKEEEIEEIDEHRDYERRDFARLTIRSLARMKREILKSISVTGRAE